MKLSKKYHNAIGFARCCTLAGIDPYAMAKLATLADRVFRGWIREANTGDYNADPARRRFQAAADEFGLDVDFSNPAPSCSKDGKLVRIPSL